MTRRLVLTFALAAAALAQTQAPPVNPKERWNKTFANPKPIFNTKPNLFLSERVQGLKPGKALDIGMGQGRNSIFLAQQGWDVTGVDISEEGVRIAKDQAAKLGVRISPVLQSADEFDYGNNQWDLVIGIFMHEIFSRNAAKIQASLKPGGLVVVEAFHDDMSKSIGRQLGYKSNDLLRAFDGLRILHYEDRIGPADWSGGEDRPIVRFVARKE